MFAEIAAKDDNAATSTATDKYIAQINGFDMSYHFVTCEIDTIATSKIGITKDAYTIFLKFF